MDLERCVRETRLTPLKESVFVRRLYACLWWRRYVDLTPLPIPMSVSWRRPSAIHRDASRWCAKAPVVSLVTCKNQYLYLWGPPDCYFQIKGKIHKKIILMSFQTLFLTVEHTKKILEKYLVALTVHLNSETAFFLHQKFFLCQGPQNMMRTAFVKCKYIFMCKHYILCKKNCKHDIIKTMCCL